MVRFNLKRLIFWITLVAVAAGLIRACAEWLMIPASFKQTWIAWMIGSLICGIVFGLLLGLFSYFSNSGDED